MGGQPVDGNSADPAAQTPTNQTYPTGVRPQLPPIGYNQSGAQVPGQYPAAAPPTASPDQMNSQGNGQMYSTYPHSPYNSGGQVYQQREW